MLPAHLSVSFPLITFAVELIWQNNGGTKDKLPDIVKFRMWVQKKIKRSALCATEKVVPGTQLFCFLPLSKQPGNMEMSL